MIPLRRERTIKAIHHKFRGAEKLEKDKFLMIAKKTCLGGTSSEVQFDSRFWKTAKTQLKTESHGKCAYCEANTEVVAHGDVEHYRPKSVYWWLAYTYDNYLYACQICNQIYKNDNFPIRGQQIPEPIILVSTTDSEIDILVGNISPDPIDVSNGYKLDRYITEHQNERALLLNPYFDDPEDYFEYEADDILKEVKVISTDPSCDLHVKAAEDYYGINRIELKNFRYSVYSKFRTLKKVHERLEDSDLRNEVLLQINDMMSDSYIFSGMNRYFNNML